MSLRDKKKYVILIACFAVAIGLFLTREKLGSQLRKSFPETFGHGSSLSSQDTPDANSKKLRQTSSTELRAGPSFDVFNDALLPNQELMAFAGINPARSDELEDILNSFWKEMTADFERNLKEIDDKDSPALQDKKGKNIRTYLIPGSEEKYEQASAKMRNELSKHFGSSSSDKLMPYLSRAEYLGGLGRYDIKLTFYDVPEYDDPALADNFKRISILQIVDTSDGKVLAGMNGPSHSADNLYYPVMGKLFGKLKK